MHHIVSLVPRHGIARSTLTEHAACRIALVKLGIIVTTRHNLGCVMTGHIRSDGQGDPALASRICAKLGCIRAHGGNRTVALKDSRLLVYLGRICTAVHRGDIVHKSAEILSR